MADQVGDYVHGRERTGFVTASPMHSGVHHAWYIVTIYTLVQCVQDDIAIFPDAAADAPHPSSPMRTTLQLLVLELAFQLLRLDQLAHRLVEVVLVDGVPLGLDRKQTTVRRKLSVNGSSNREVPECQLTPLSPRSANQHRSAHRSSSPHSQSRSRPPSARRQHGS